MAETNAEAIRSSPLFQELGDEPEAFREVAEAYVRETRANLARLPASISAGEAVEVRRLAHTVKGAMRSLGASEAASEALSLEELARDGDLAEAPALLARVEARVREVLPPWDALLASRRPSG